MEKKYTSEDGLKFLEIAGISLSPNEMGLFKSEYGKIYQSSSRYKNLVGTLWEIYSNILPFKANPDRNNRESYFEHLSRDEIFHDNVIKSGLDKKLASGVSIAELALGINLN